MTDPDWPQAAKWLESNSPNAEFVLVGVPSASASPTGSQAHLTPPRLRRVLEDFSTYSSETEIDLEELPVRDLGDWPVGGMEMTQAQSDIEHRSAALDHTLVHAFIGGDDAITRPIANGYGLAGLGILSFDSRHNVGSLDNGPSHETAIRGLIADGLPGGRITQIGTHSFSNSEAHRRYCDEQSVTVFPMDTVDLWGIEETVTVALDQLARVSEWIYINFDLGVLDVAFAPGCRAARPGGLTSRQLAAAAHLCGRHPLVRAADFVEVDPHRDHDDLTTMNLASAFLAFGAGVAARPPVDA